MNDAMSAEFDTVADWTADVAIALGPDHYLPAGCRGSGSPSTLRWFVETLQLTPDDRMLDCGAGVGGPSAFAQERVGVRPVLAEPEPGACRSALRLFDLPVVRCDATALPFPDGSFDVAWSLGVLCTVSDQPALLAELRRVLTDDGWLGLLVFVAETPDLPEHPDGNDFPTRHALAQLLAGAGLRVEATTTERAEERSTWHDRADAVEKELDRRHHDEPAWQMAQAQAATIGRLIRAGAITALCLILRPDPAAQLD